MIGVHRVVLFTILTANTAFACLPGMGSPGGCCQSAQTSCGNPCSAAAPPPPPPQAYPPQAYPPPPSFLYASGPAAPVVQFESPPPPTPFYESAPVVKEEVQQTVVQQTTVQPTTVQPTQSTKAQQQQQSEFFQEAEYPQEIVQSVPYSQLEPVDVQPLPLLGQPVSSYVVPNGPIVAVPSQEQTPADLSKLMPASGVLGENMVEAAPAPIHPGYGEEVVEVEPIVQQVRVESAAVEERNRGEMVAKSGVKPVGVKITRVESSGSSGYDQSEQATVNELLASLEQESTTPANLDFHQVTVFPQEQHTTVDDYESGPLNEDRKDVPVHQEIAATAFTIPTPMENVPEQSAPILPPVHLQPIAPAVMVNNTQTTTTIALVEQDQHVTTEGSDYVEVEESTDRIPIAESGSISGYGSKFAKVQAAETHKSNKPIEIDEGKTLDSTNPYGRMWIF